MKSAASCGKRIADARAAPTAGDGSILKSRRVSSALSVPYVLGQSSDFIAALATGYLAVARSRKTMCDGFPTGV
jgi:hypothetical protein